MNKLKKVFYDLTLHSMLRKLYISKYKILHKSMLITVAKTCEKVLVLNMSSRSKVKSGTFSFIV